MEGMAMNPPMTLFSPWSMKNTGERSRRPPRTRGFVLCLVFLFPCLSARPEEPDRNDQVTIDETDEDRAFLESAAASAYRGRYLKAGGDLREYLADFPESEKALEALSRLELMYGHPEQAEELASRWLALDKKSEGAVVVLSRARQARGELSQAERTLEEALSRRSDSLTFRAELADLLMLTGRREEAHRLARESLELRQLGDLDGAGKLARGRLHLLLGDFKSAARTAVYADEEFNGRVGPNYRREKYEALLLLAELNRITRLDSGNRALALFNDILKINPNHPDGLVGRAATRLYGNNGSGAVEDCDRALLLNPVHVKAIDLKARMLIYSSQFNEALKLVEKGLAANRSAKQLLARRAAALYMQGDREGCERSIRAALELDPSFGSAYSAVGEALLHHHRLSEARGMFEACLRVEPDSSEAFVFLGRTLANLGYEEEAEEALRESVRLDPYEYPWRYNMLRILSDLKGWKRISRGENAVFALDIEECDVLQRCLPDLFEASWKEFEKKFGFSPDKPILVEVFPDHDDFAVRTVGFTGLGALGVCFGKVVTMLSPRAAGVRGQFVWARTLHHELAHVFSLELSDYRVPRWLTEGISVHEEFCNREGWDRDMQFDLYNAYHNNDLIPIARFNPAFLGPRVLMAYYQAGLLVKYMKDTYGWQSVIAMLKAYAEDKATETIIRDVFGKSSAELDTEFREWVGGTFLAGIKMHPFYNHQQRRRFSDRLRKAPGDTDLLARAAWACFRQNKRVDARYYLDRLLKIEPGNASGLLLTGEIAMARNAEDRASHFLRKGIEKGGGDYHACLHLGMIEKKHGRLDEAIRYLEEAIDCFPGHVGPESPYHLLPALYLSRGDREKAVELLEQKTAYIEYNLPDRLEIARYYSEAGSHLDAVKYLEEIVEIDPFIRSVHLDLGRSLHALGRLEEALGELETARLVTPPREKGPRTSEGADQEDYWSLADIHAEKAAVLLDLDRPDEARRELERAVSCNPNHEKALELQDRLRNR